MTASALQLPGVSQLTPLLLPVQIQPTEPPASGDFAPGDFAPGDFAVETT